MNKAYELAKQGFNHIPDGKADHFTFKDEEGRNMEAYRTINERGRVSYGFEVHMEDNGLTTFGNGHTVDEAMEHALAIKEGHLKPGGSWCAGCGARYPNYAPTTTAPIRCPKTGILEALLPKKPELE